MPDYQRHCKFIHWRRLNKNKIYLIPIISIFSIITTQNIDLEEQYEI